MRQLNGQREEYERMADSVRARLLRTIDAIDERRHTLLDVRAQARRHAGVAVLATVAFAALAGAGVAFAVRHVRSRDQRRRRERLHALARVWRHPDRVAPGGVRGVIHEIGRKVLVGAVTVVATELMRRGLRLLLDLPGATKPPPLPPLLPPPPEGTVGGGP